MTLPLPKAAKAFTADDWQLRSGAATCVEGTPPQWTADAAKHSMWAAQGAWGHLAALLCGCCAHEAL